MLNTMLSDNRNYNATKLELYHCMLIHFIGSDNDVRHIHGYFRQFS